MGFTYRGPPSLSEGPNYGAHNTETQVESHTQCLVYQKLLDILVVGGNPIVDCHERCRPEKNFAITCHIGVGLNQAQI